MLRHWRLKKGLSLADCAGRLGIASAGMLSDIERGVVFPSPESIAKIEGATRGAISVAHHWAAWRRAHPQKFAEFRAAGRAAGKTYRSTPAKPKTTKGDRHGGKSIGR